MRSPALWIPLAAAFFGGLAHAAGTSAATKPAVPAAPAAGRGVSTGPDFTREVRPILAGHCFKCHGPDEKNRMGGLRLDVREAAVAPLKNGRRAVVPGRPDQSELVKRVLLADGAPGQMPPAHAKLPLTTEQKATLRQWVASGAVYRPHWAFVPPKQAPLPKVKDASWPRNPIDYFVLSRIEAAGLKPSPRADKYTLVRRLYLDLIGLPPTTEEADTFVRECEEWERGSATRRVLGSRYSVLTGNPPTAKTQHPIPGAEPDREQKASPTGPSPYEKLVDRLLASPHYGERWGRRWLDIARYADTNGYEKDRPRSIWPYRDWVINALNRDMPFDQFTVEQLAGDMLPNATPEQRIATGFHRNTMLNEEGGIDPLEFRYYAMVDRVSTTATAWLGLTLGCAQCHTHKYDPVPHREYFQFMAFMDNTEEPEIEIGKPEVLRQRSEIARKIEAMQADLVNRFPVEGSVRWSQGGAASVTTAGGAVAERLPDGSVRLAGAAPETDTYTVVLESEAPSVSALRLEALPDPAFGGGGPGRTQHGNFVLGEITVTVAPKDRPEQAQPVKLVRAEADFSQDNFPVAHAIDGNQKTGWAIHGPGNWNVRRVATFYPEQPVSLPGGARWTVRLDQQYGGQHTLGKFRLSLGEPAPEDGRPEAERRREHLDRKFAAWLREQEARAVEWTIVKPAGAKSNLPLLTVQDDASVFVSGDQSKRDVYDLKLQPGRKGITALRLEVLPDERLPKHGPGRVYYEGPHGDFFLSEVTVKADGAPVKISRASHSFAGGGGADRAIDGDPQTGWTVNGGQGRGHTAVFNFAQPVDAASLDVSLLFERYHAAGLGRFRLAVTSDPRSAQAGLPADVEPLLRIPAERRTAEQKDRLLRHYLSVAPELEGERAELRRLQASMPALPTTLAMQERPAENPRATFVRHRGEFLQPKEQVEPGTLSALHPFPASVKRDRLAFARWLVDPKNPLVGRVTVNRQWAALFGKGLVRTVEDFGLQGEAPSHPELLDFLATVFVAPAESEWEKGRMGEWQPRRVGEREQGRVGATEQGKGQGGTHPPIPPLSHSPTQWSGAGWSLKQIHRLIVTSATYQQSSRVTPEHLAKDPQNRLLARAPRFRLEAELVRDAALRESGLLSTKIGGPSVFPPQPAGVTSEGTYGPLAWKVSEGEDRYRRGLYTFTKRTAPYAMFLTFDGSSGEACIARREVSNTPLQALTLLNDVVFLETAQALGRMTMKLTPSPSQSAEEQRAIFLFRRCLTRPPSKDELASLVRFFEGQKTRFQSGALRPSALAGDGTGAAAERAAWTALARVLLNLDEAVVRP